MVTVDSRGLGRLRRVASARSVWANEASDFTPWLAENLDVLADELGLTLSLVATEVPVGTFRLDIQAQTPDGQTVVIENQLEVTDHGHLGQAILYAASLEAAAVVWVAPSFREESRRALDWLNERTDTGVDFFGVEVSVVQIGDDGPRAPVFDVVARPNGWQKSVKTATRQAADAAGPTLNELRQEFFQEVLTALAGQRPRIRVPRPNRDSWVSYSGGPFGHWDISFAGDGRLRIEVYVDCGDAARNKALFDSLYEERDRWESCIGHPVSWERLDDRRACRIASYQDVSLIDAAVSRGELVAGAVDLARAMHDCLNDELRSRAIALRDAR